MADLQLSAVSTSDSIALGSLVVSALALLSTLVGWIINRAHNRRVTAAAERAERVAERSAVAAERSAAAQERVAQAFSDFLSRQERAAADEEGPRAAASGEAGDAAKQSDPVRWTVDRRDDRSYILTILRGNAHNVRLRAANAVRFDGPDGPIGRMTPGDTQSFLAVGSWETGVPQLVVTWEDADGTQREWRRVVP